MGDLLPRTGPEVNLQVGHCSVSVLPFPEGVGEALGHLGDYTASSKRIRLSDEMPASEQAEVLLHEVIHACFDIFGWNERETLTEEQVCTFVAKGLAQVFQANPILHEKLHQALTNGKDIV